MQFWSYIKMGKKGPLPGKPQVSRDETKCAWGVKEAERGKPGFPKLPSNKTVWRNLCFWSQHLVAA